MVISLYPSLLGISVVHELSALIGIKDLNVLLCHIGFPKVFG